MKSTEFFCPVGTYSTVQYSTAYSSSSYRITLDRHALLLERTMPS